MTAPSKASLSRVEYGRSVLFIPRYRLVQELPMAKRNHDLPRMLRRLDNFNPLIIDDLGYLPQGAENWRYCSP